jgi:molybdenum cofactor cytidylyltransferase
MNPDPARGMFSSVQAGCVAAEGADPLLILPGDMPFVRPDTVAAVLAAYARSGRIVSPRFAGKRGHPIALPPALRNEILTADPGTSLEVLLKTHESTRVSVDVDDDGLLRDVDRPADL